ncbi:myogenesis-regulating glycosidase isoform X1 [Tribolium madens]|uniref:myogenesis-regulating glycosidase isoform X1 n=2 Tax=Tribolium madens TaxID=41895 RepID=UPI001CF74901|nr:myogenesis-regulating glycosidase isoform X1 [Tribolium madens]XP_044259482.1 myogenesis-regulating glycosidase isoform X1 [Tribolium madens]
MFKTYEEIPIIVVDPPPMEPQNTTQETSLNIEEKDEEKTGETERRLSLRRNSISLPNLDDLQVLKQHVQIANDGDEDTDSDYELPPTSRTPLRNARRKSVTSPRMLKPPVDDESGSNSPANSITSINSLASLLREKMQMLPATLRKKKTPDYKTRIFVALLFITIVVLIFCAYFLYHQKVLQKAYFQKIKFNKIKRLMKIYNTEGVEIIRARLGTTIKYDKALPCLPIDEKHDGSICFEWMGNARLYLQYYQLNPEVKCYNLQWIALNDGMSPTDCFSLGDDHWYGGGQTAESAWPLEKGNHDFAPFITGRVDKHEYGNVLKRYFISAKGVAVLVDDKTPLQVSISSTDNKELCLRAKYDDFAYVNRLTKTANLNYSICTSTDMTKLHSNLVENALWDGLKLEDMNVVNSLLTEPLWEITSSSKSELTEETISNYTDNVIALGFLKQGHVLINEFWQKNVGDFEVDSERFPGLEEVITVMHRRGFRIVFSIQPFISTESYNFGEAVKKRLLVSERFSDRRIPALTRYKSSQSAGVLDPTNNKTIPWLLAKLKSVVAKYKFDAYYLDLGIAYNMPHYYQCEKPLINPDQYKTYFINNLQSSVSLFGVNSAVERPKAPTFVSLPQFESSWDGLRRVIPTILTYGLLGYPFLIPGAVGGDVESPDTIFYANYSSELLPDKELYVRWLQLATFLPVIRFTHLPSTFGDDVMDMAKILTSLRQTKVTPLLKKYAKTSLDTGLPLIRPLWMLEYNDTACHVVADEFSIGEDLIVAPVLYSGAREREIYLPAGVWKDGIDNSLRKGSRWIHDYKVEQNEIAYFEKMPDDTRF